MGAKANQRPGRDVTEVAGPQNVPSLSCGDGDGCAGRIAGSFFQKTASVAPCSSLEELGVFRSYRWRAKAEVRTEAKNAGLGSNPCYEFLAA